MYLDYELLKNLIENFKEGVKRKEYMKLIGFYTLTKHRAMIPLDIFKTEKRTPGLSLDQQVPASPASRLLEDAEDKEEVDALR